MPMQLTHFHRLLDPEAAVKRALGQIKAADPRSVTWLMHMQLSCRYVDWHLD